MKTSRWHSLMRPDSVEDLTASEIAAGCRTYEQTVPVDTEVPMGEIEHCRCDAMWHPHWLKRLLNRHLRRWLRIEIVSVFNGVMLRRFAVRSLPKRAKRERLPKESEGIPF